MGKQGLLALMIATFPQLAGIVMGAISELGAGESWGMPS